MDVQAIRRDFPILDKRVANHPLIYLDNAATTQIPNQVLDAYDRHFREENANVHRGIHTLSNSSTQAFENARETVRSFIGAQHTSNIVFTRGTTDSLNMAARGLEHLLHPGDAVVVSLLEHHSNFVPWQQVCKRTGAEFRVCGLTAQGDIDLDSLAHLSKGAKILAVSGCSNVLGSMLPIRAVANIAHDANALFVLDGAQVMRHAIVDVSEWGCDYLGFSGHKMMAPPGIGVLYGTDQALDLLEPMEFGGEMVDRVDLTTTTFSDLPLRLEAGTPNYPGAIALGAAIDYLNDIGRISIVERESALTDYAVKQLGQLSGVRIWGNPEKRNGCVSFSMEGAHPFDICALADKLGIALRSGTNCAQPLLRQWCKCEYVTRLSPAFYNTEDEIEQAAAGLAHIAEILQR